MIIGITGTIGAGKGTIVEYLKKKGFKHYSVRQYLLELIREKGMAENRNSMVIVANELRSEYGPSAAVEKLLEKAKASGGDAVIESIRAVGEIEKLRQDDDFVLFAVDADAKKRYERNSKRGSETDDEKDLSEFLAREEREMENTDPTKQNLRGCIELADYKFTNDGTVDELYENVEGVIDELRKKKD